MRRAAIVLTSLPQDEAAQLIGKLAPRQAQAVSIEIAKLGRCPHDERKEALQAFVAASPHAAAGCAGGVEVATSLPESALGSGTSSSAPTVPEAIDATPFAFLKRVDPQSLIPFINTEHPQTIALILSHLPPDYGAQVVAGLTMERQLAVTARIADMGPTNPGIIELVAGELKKRIVEVIGRPQAKPLGEPKVIRSGR